jgi:nicotinamidase-related amidase
LANDYPARGDRTALLVIDMLNTYEHDDADKLAESVAEAVPTIGRLIERARSEDVFLVYVNDNYGDWNSSAEELADRAQSGRHPELVEPLLPIGDSAFVVKARHSAFYATLLEYILESEGVGRIVLTGQATEQCILYTALDAYVRHFQVTVPRDAVAHIHENLARAALEMMERNMHAEITDADATPLRRTRGGRRPTH